MKRLLLLLLLCAGSAFAQVGIEIGNPTDRGPVLPATCAIGQGWYFKTSATDGNGAVGMYWCVNPAAIYPANWQGPVGPTGTGSFSAGGDLSGTSSSQEVIGILSHALPALTTGYLNWTGSAWALSAGGGGDTITSPNSTLSVGGTASNTTLDVVGAAGEILAGATPALTYTPQLGVDNSHAGTLALSNGSAAAHTTLGSAATTTNTVNFFAAVPTTGHLIDCTVASTTCTLHDSGVVTANVVNASSPGAGIARFAGSTQTVTSSELSGFGTTSGSNALVPGHVANGQTLTIDSGGTLTCAGGSTCPSGSGTVTSSGTPLIHQVPIWTTSTNLIGLANGTTGQFLGANTGADPSWQTPAGSGTVTASGTPAQYDLPYWTTATNLTKITAPTVNGLYFPVYSVTGSAAVAPTSTVSTGLPAGTAIGSVDTGTPKITFGTNSVTISQPVTVSGAGLLGLAANASPSPAASTFSFFGPTSVSTAWGIQLPGAENGSAGVLHVGAASSHVSAATISQVVAADTDTSIAHTGVDVNTSYQVTATHLASALPHTQGGTDNTAATTDGQLLIGSTSDGLWHKATITAGTNVTVTNSGGGITIAAAGGGSGCSTSGSAGDLLTDNGSGGCNSLTDFVFTTHTLAGGASAILDMHAASVTGGWKPPAAAGAAPTTAGVVSFDTTATQPVYGDGSNTRRVVGVGSTPTNNNCAKFTVSGTNVLVSDSGGPCGSGGSTTVGGIWGAVNPTGSTSASHTQWFSAFSGGGAFYTPSPAELTFDNFSVYTTTANAVGNMWQLGTEYNYITTATVNNRSYSIPPGAAAGVFASSNSFAYPAAMPFDFNFRTLGGGTAASIHSVAMEITGQNVAVLGTAGNGTATVAGSTTVYTGPGQRDGYLTETTEAKMNVVVPYALTAGPGFCVYLHGAQPAGGGLTYTLRKNGVDTTLVISAPASAPAGSYCDMTHSVSFSATDLMTYKVVNASGSASAVPDGLTLLITPVGGSATGMFTVGMDTQVLAGGTFFGLFGSPLASSGSTYDLVAIAAPRAFTLKNLHCYATAAGTANPSIFTLIKNGSATALTVTLATGASYPADFADTSDSVSVAKGDLISMGFTLSSGTAATVSSCTMEYD